jgi:hypothetical protein
MGSILLIKKRFIQDTSSLNREGVLTLHMIMMIPKTETGRAYAGWLSTILDRAA